MIEVWYAVIVSFPVHVINNSYSEVIIYHYCDCYRPYSDVLLPLEFMYKHIPCVSYIL